MSVAIAVPQATSSDATAASTTVAEAFLSSYDDPIDAVSDLLVRSPPRIGDANSLLKTFLRQSPYAAAWQLFLTAHELSTSSPLPDAVHQEWLQAVGMDCGAARLYAAVSRHIAGPKRLMAILSAAAAANANGSSGQQQQLPSGEQQRLAALGKAKYILELALVTPMEELDEVAKAYEPIAGAALEAVGGGGSSSLGGGLGGGASGMGIGVGGGAAHLMTPQLRRRFEAAKAIFDAEGAWPQRHHSSPGTAAHVRQWSAALQRLFSTYVTLATYTSSATSNDNNTLQPPRPFPFASTVEHCVSLLAPEEAAQLRNTQLRRIHLAMRQALAQCPNEPILLIHYCAFVACATNSTEEARKALVAHLVATPTASATNNSTSDSGVPPLPLFSPALAAMAIALTKIESAADLFTLLKSAAAPSVIAGAKSSLDLTVVANRKRFREYCNLAKEGKEHGEDGDDSNKKAELTGTALVRRPQDASTAASRWHVYAEWLEVECHHIDSRAVAGTIASKGFEQLRAAAETYDTPSVDALALFAHRAHRMHSAHGDPERAQQVAEVLVRHLSQQTMETVGEMRNKTGRRLASAPVNTLREACALLPMGGVWGHSDASSSATGIAPAASSSASSLIDHPEAASYINGGRAQREGASALAIATAHSRGLGPMLPLLSPAEAQWAVIVSDAHEATRRYADDTEVPNEMKCRFHRLGQAMPWGPNAAPDDGLCADPLFVYEVTEEEMAAAVAAAKEKESDDAAEDGRAAAPAPLAPLSSSTVNGWRPFVPPPNAEMAKMSAEDPDSDAIRAPFSLRGYGDRAIVVDERTALRQEREAALRAAEGGGAAKSAASALDHLPSKVVRLMKRIPPTVEINMRIASADSAWLLANAFSNIALEWEAFKEANRKNSEAPQQL